MKRAVTVVILVCALIVGSVGIPSARAADVCYTASIDKDNIVAFDTVTKVIDFEDLSAEAINPATVLKSRAGSTMRATSRIEWDIPPKTIMKADTVYSLEADEVVTINCTFSPRTADLDFGFITPDDVFHFTSGSNGSIKVNIEIQNTGKYYFAVRNNTSKTVEVLGYVYY